MVLRPRSSDAVAPASDAATFYRLAGDGNMDAIEVRSCLADCIRDCATGLGSRLQLWQLGLLFEPRVIFDRTCDSTPAAAG